MRAPLVPPLAHRHDQQAVHADRPLHEARDRDYFFVLSFWAWGLWVGMGAVALVHRWRLSSPLGIAVAALPAALMGGVLLLTEILRGVSSWIRTAQADLVQDHISSLIHRQSVVADLAFYETPEFYDHLHRARSEAAYRPVALLETLGSFAQNGISYFCQSVFIFFT